MIENQRDTIQDKYLTIRVGNDEYGIEIEYVVDIIKMQDITRVPGTPDYIIGITNLRGTIVPVMDVHLRFGQPRSEYDERTCIVMVSVDNVLVGMVVDAVLEVAIIPAARITHPPRTGSVGENRYIRGITSFQDNGRESIKLMLDIDHLLYDHDPIKEKPVA